MPEQEMIDVFVKGKLITTVPKASEQHIRRVYLGSPEERTLEILPQGYKPDDEKIKNIREKLIPKN